MFLMCQIVMLWLFLVFCDEEEPVTFNEAQNSKNWLAAMQIEYDAIMKNGTWLLVDLPVGKKAIGTK